MSARGLVIVKTDGTMVCLQVNSAAPYKVRWDPERKEEFLHVISRPWGFPSEREQRSQVHRFYRSQVAWIWLTTEEPVRWPLKAPVVNR